MPRFHSGRASGARSGAVYGLGAAFRNARHSGMAVVLFQGANDRPRALSRARRVHSAHETEEHAALDARRRTDHASGTRILRLIRPPYNEEWGRLPIPLLTGLKNP